MPAVGRVAVSERRSITPRIVRTVVVQIVRMDPVRLTIVSNEPEAEMLCDLLRSEGIECMHRVTDLGAGALDGVAAIGAREVLVHQADLERARELAAPAE